VTPHERHQSDLPQYVAGRLQGEELRSLEQHLEVCEECRKTAAAWRNLVPAMREGGPAMLDPHPGETDLRAFALGTPGAPVERVVPHVAVCASCELDVEAWRSWASWGNRASRSRGPIRLRTTLVASLSVAAGLILGFGLSLVLVSPRREGSAAPAPGEPARHLVLPSSIPRGGGAALRYTLELGQKHLEIDFRPVIPEDASDADCCRFEIRREGGETIWSTVMTAAAARGRLASDQVIGFNFPVAFLGPGRYDCAVRRPREGDEEAAQWITVEILAPD